RDPRAREGRRPRAGRAVPAVRTAPPGARGRRGGAPCAIAARPRAGPAAARAPSPCIRRKSSRSTSTKSPTAVRCGSSPRPRGRRPVLPPARTGVSPHVALPIALPGPHAVPQIAAVVQGNKRLPLAVVPPPRATEPPEGAVMPARADALSEVGTLGTVVRMLTP